MSSPRAPAFTGGDRMASTLSRRGVLQALLAAAGSGLPGCGTIFYPERRGQPAGRFDWKVIALDAVGLFFFFIPGVIAFAVDFSTGTIYLPPEACSYQGNPQVQAGLVSVKLPENGRTLKDVERCVSQESRRQVHLIEGQYYSQPMGDLGEFDDLQRASAVEPA
jgi:hypothetical protein